VDAFDAEPVQAEDDADDIDDGVDGAYFVEVDAVDGGAVDFGLGLGEAQEDAFGVFFYVGSEVGFVDDFVDVGQVAVALGGKPGLDVEVGGGDALLFYFFYDEFVAVDRQFGQFTAQQVLGQAEVEEGAEKHVAADAAKAVEIKGAHSFHLILLMMLASWPAPKPLSMLTTATPAAQLLSMASRAAMPPKLAP